MVAVRRETSTATPARPAAGRVSIAGTSPAGTDLAVADDGAGDRHVHVSNLPDPERARWVASRVDRIAWQRLDLASATPRAVVAGVRHRRPVQVPVGIPTALALLQAGVPTLASGS